MKVKIFSLLNKEIYSLSTKKSILYLPKNEFIVQMEIVIFVF